jgi:hypothetical protein
MRYAARLMRGQCFMPKAIHLTARSLTLAVLPIARRRGGEH